MSHDESSTHDFVFDLICDYFSRLERQGPSSPQATLKALSFINGLDENSIIANIGCGTGGQTMIIAQNVPGSIVGVDLFPAFIDIFNENAKKNHLSNRVMGIIATMEQLPFYNDEYNLIWSEGAIYNIGFARGLRKWNKYLKRGGYVAVSEASWFTNERPKEIELFWTDAYPEIDIISNKVGKMENAGYVPIATSFCQRIAG